MNRTWQFLDENGCLVSVSEDVADPASFHSQADAETWVGESWQELLDVGVESVNLLNNGAISYGPMSLRPANPPQ